MSSVWKEKRGKWKGKWRALVRRNHHSISKTFLSKGSVTAWAKEIEYQLDRDQYEDFIDSARISLGDLITRYRDEIAPLKKGKDSEKHKLNFILRQGIKNIYESN